MGPVFYVMAILGCADGALACREAGVADTRFVSADSCMLAAAHMLETSADLGFPTLIAECRPEREPALTARGGARDG